jgi:YebC/PmpR family DNA-binding regulatory protein
MGRIFETRKATMFARWDKMAKLFTRVGKDIAIAVKASGPNPESNPALRRAIQNGRAANMPKDKIESAIKRAAGRDAADYEEALYEGYGPHGVAVLVETATDNNIRTIANVRMHFNKNGGKIGTSGSVAYMFDRVGTVRLKPEGLDLESLELDLIDHGLTDMGESVGDNGEPQIVLRCAFPDFGRLQAAVEAKGIAPLSSEAEYLPQTTVQLDEAQANEVLALVDKLEQDDDVQKVFHNLT